MTFALFSSSPSVSFLHCFFIILLFPSHTSLSCSSCWLKLKHSQVLERISWSVRNVCDSQENVWFHGFWMSCLQGSLEVPAGLWIPHFLCSFSLSKNFFPCFYSPRHIDLTICCSRMLVCLPKSLSVFSLFFSISPYLLFDVSLSVSLPHAHAYILYISIPIIYLFFYFSSYSQVS